MRSHRSRSQSASPRQAHGIGPSGLLLAALAAVIGLSGCKTPDFIGRRYSNFTAYYNTFYNAERQFEAGYDNLDRFGAEVDREQYLPLFVKTTGTSASREFEQTVLKSADILREHPESKWVDDALMLIGKSYFYQENYVGAIQKFTEVVDQQTNLRDEAQFWLARSLMTSGAYDEALEVLTLAMAQDDVDEQWVAQDRLLLAELAIRQELWEDAADNLEAGLESVKDKELAARASFLLGQVQETLGRHEEAYDAYRGVRDYPAPYELDYAARYSAARVDGMYLNPERALRDVRKMERDDKNVIKTAELRFLRARILQEVGGVDDAIATYDELLYDPLALPPGASLGDLRGRIHYAMGELYRDIDRNFVMAAAHFDTAAAALGGTSTSRSSSRTVAAVDEALAPEAIQDASLLKDSFSRYASVYRDVARYDSLLFLGSLPQEEYDARILDLRRKRAEELEEQRRLMQQRQRDQAFRESASQSGLNVNRGLQEGKVIPVHGDPTGTAAGYLQHEDPIRVQEGRLQFQNVWGNRPLVPNWRRSAALSAADVEVSEEELAQQEAMLQELETNELPDIDDSAVPRDSTDQVTMQAARAISRYELGNILFLGMSRPDSAAVWYRTVIQEDSSQAVASRAQFALAEVQRALGDSLSAVRLYRDLLSRFPESDFIPSVQDRLGMEATVVVASDSSALALQAFERALMLKEDQPYEAIDSLLTVASNWMTYPQAPRALFAVSNIHLTEAMGDSAAVFEPIPFSVSTDVLAPLWPDKFKTQAQLDSLAAAAANAKAVADSVNAELGMRSDSEVVMPADSLEVPAADSIRMDLQEEGLAGEPAEMPSDSLVVDPVAADSAVADPVAADSAVADPVAANSAVADPVAADSAMVDPLDADTAPDDLVEADSLVTDNAAPDSTRIAPLLPESAGADSTQAALDGRVLRPDSAGVDVLSVEVMKEVAPVLTVEDVLKKVVSMESRTELGLRAQSTLAAIVELRTPPIPEVDSLAVDSLSLAEVAADSLASDSLQAVAAEGVARGAVVPTPNAPVTPSEQAALGEGKVLESDEEPAVAERPQAAMADSLVMALVAQAAAKQDSLRIAREQQSARQERPANRVEEEDGEEVRSSTDLKPMMPNGQLDTEAVGYTFTFGSHFERGPAQEQFRMLRQQLAETGYDLYLISNAEGEQQEYLVGWGLFLSRQERDEAEAEFSAILPEQRNILHLLPAE